MALFSSWSSRNGCHSANPCPQQVPDIIDRDRSCVATRPRAATGQPKIRLPTSPSKDCRSSSPHSRRAACPPHIPNWSIKRISCCSVIIGCPPCPALPSEALRTSPSTGTVCRVLLARHSTPSRPDLEHIRRRGDSSTAATAKACGCPLVMADAVHYRGGGSLVPAESMAALANAM